MKDFESQENIVSPKKVTTPSKLRTFTVEDESVPQHHQHSSSEDNRLSQLEEEIKRLREDKAKGIKRLTPENKKRVEFITNIGRLSKDITIEDLKITVRTLKNKEIKNIILENSKKEEFQYLSESMIAAELQKQVLAASLYRFNDEPVENYLGDDSFESRFNFVEELDEYVLAKILKEYNAMIVEAKEKYGLNDEQSAKEVIEEIKKA